MQSQKIHIPLEHPIPSHPPPYVQLCIKYLTVYIVCHFVYNSSGIDMLKGDGQEYVSKGKDEYKKRQKEEQKDNTTEKDEHKKTGREEEELRDSAR